MRLVEDLGDVADAVALVDAPRATRIFMEVLCRVQKYVERRDEGPRSVDCRGLAAQHSYLTRGALRTLTSLSWAPLKAPFRIAGGTFVLSTLSFSAELPRT